MQDLALGYYGTKLGGYPHNIALETPLNTGYGDPLELQCSLGDSDQGAQLAHMRTTVHAPRLTTLCDNSITLMSLTFKLQA